MIRNVIRKRLLLITLVHTIVSETVFCQPHSYIKKRCRPDKTSDDASRPVLKFPRSISVVERGTIPYNNGIFHRRRKRGGGPGGGQAPPNNLRGGANIPFRPPPPPNNPPTFSFNFYMKQEKNHKCTKLKGKILINATLI